MKARLIFGAVIVVGLFGVGTFASRGDASVSAPRQWTIVNVLDPVSVKGEIVMGPVMIVHDDQKMERGEPCTTFYRFDPARGPRLGESALGQRAFEIGPVVTGPFGMGVADDDAAHAAILAAAAAGKDGRQGVRSAPQLHSNCHLALSQRSSTLQAM